MYGIDGKKFRRQYKKSLSEFKNWTQNDLNDIIKLEVEAGEMQDPLKCGIASFAITDFTAQKLTL